MEIHLNYLILHQRMFEVTPLLIKQRKYQIFLYMYHFFNKLSYLRTKKIFSLNQIISMNLWVRFMRDLIKLHKMIKMISTTLRSMICRLIWLKDLEMEDMQIIKVHMLNKLYFSQKNHLIYNNIIIKTQ